MSYSMPRLPLSKQTLNLGKVEVKYSDGFWNYQLMP